MSFLPYGNDTPVAWVSSVGLSGLAHVSVAAMLLTSTIPLLPEVVEQDHPLSGIEISLDVLDTSATADALDVVDDSDLQQDDLTPTEEETLAESDAADVLEPNADDTTPEEVAETLPSEDEQDPALIEDTEPLAEEDTELAALTPEDVPPVEAEDQAPAEEDVVPEEETVLPTPEEETPAPLEEPEVAEVAEPEPEALEPEALEPVVDPEPTPTEDVAEAPAEALEPTLDTSGTEEEPTILPSDAGEEIAIDSTEPTLTEDAAPVAVVDDAELALDDGGSLDSGAADIPPAVVAPPQLDTAEALAPDATGPDSDEAGEGTVASEVADLAPEISGPEPVGPAPVAEPQAPVAELLEPEIAGPEVAQTPVADAAPATEDAALPEIAGDATEVAPVDAGGVPAEDVTVPEIAATEDEVAPEPATDPALEEDGTSSVVVVDQETAPTEAEVPQPVAEDETTTTDTDEPFEVAALPPEQQQEAAAPTAPQEPATGGRRAAVPIANPTAQDVAIGRLIRQVRALPDTNCALALPRRAPNSGVGLSLIGADFDDLGQLGNRLAQTMPADAQPTQVVEVVDARQCALLDTIRKTDSYPASRIGLSLEDTVLVSGDRLRGRILGAGGLYIAVLLIDDNGVVQDLSRFVEVEDNTPVFDVPVARAGASRDTRQVLLVLGTADEPLNLSANIGDLADDVFAGISREVVQTAVYGLATFDVR